MSLFPSSKNYDLDYKLHRVNVPYRVYKYQRIPPLINRVPVKMQRTHVGMGVKGSFSPHKIPRISHLPPEQIKFQTRELHSIVGELNQIKAQVDSLLQSLECMDQQRAQPPGTEDREGNCAPESPASSCRTTESRQKLKGHAEVNSSEESTGQKAMVVWGLAPADHPQQQRCKERLTVLPKSVSPLTADALSPQLVAVWRPKAQVLSERSAAGVRGVRCR
ncbi:hypothetical protein J0S82_020028 [Galemys pyrenaicus]|uniref:Uncharacterized protein n=1 Tax=Galemys pyrenaicus TaxID=202257 RepID=A0A8J6AUM2_GALPY|nr:hypothetical protein J0S82_020028 [Galemys pyrenaicus]